jgi:hypothetical protein
VPPQRTVRSPAREGTGASVARVLAETDAALAVNTATAALPGLTGCALLTAAVDVRLRAVQYAVRAAEPATIRLVGQEAQPARTNGWGRAVSRDTTDHGRARAADGSTAIDVGFVAIRDSVEAVVFARRCGIATSAGLRSDHRATGLPIFGDGGRTSPRSAPPDGSRRFAIDAGAQHSGIAAATNDQNPRADDRYPHLVPNLECRSFDARSDSRNTTAAHLGFQAGRTKGRGRDRVPPLKRQNP